MSFAQSEGLLTVARDAQSLDTKLTGEAYLKSREKQELDRIGLKIMRPLCLPVLGLARFAVFLQDGSPTTVALKRVGKDGIPFYQKKVRSMYKGTELGESRHALKLSGDPQVTRIGRVIRKCSVDELMQLGNIQVGEMSLVGARPLSEGEFRDYSASDALFESAYCLARPGLTGLEQVSGRANLTPAARIDLIRQYAEEACLALDLDIIKKTAHVALSGDGAC